jgi:putative hemolysin
MDSALIGNVIGLVGLLVFSAFFSGSETAVFSLNHLERHRLRRGATGFKTRVLNQPEEVLVTILMGNMVVNLLFASVMDGVMEDLLGDGAWFYSILAGTILLLIFGEMTPKNIAIRHSVSFFAFSTPVLNYIHVAFTPIRTVLEFVQRHVVAYLSGRLRAEERDHHALITSTLRAGLQKGLVHPSELAVAESFLDFREKTAADVMIPRTSLKGLPAEARIEEAISFAAEEETHAPILVYEEDIDHIKGYVTPADLLGCRFGLTDARRISSLTRSLHPVPETKNLFELMREMIAENTEVALVVDEYGGTGGVVPFALVMEDFLQFFYPTDRRFLKNPEGHYTLPGTLRVESVSELLGTPLESESRTLSGLITEQLEEIPTIGQSVRIGTNVFTVRRVSQRRIIEVEVAPE